MYEAHGWFGLAESPHDINDGALGGKVEEVRDFVAGQHCSATLAATILALNGQHWLVVNAFANRRRDEADWIDALLELVRRELPGAWGTLYERDDETSSSPGPNAFAVTVLARGKLSKRLDPFLSPCNPVIED
jgi:hypothetical protein